MKEDFLFCFWDLGGGAVVFSFVLLYQSGHQRAMRGRDRNDRMLDVWGLERRMDKWMDRWVGGWVKRQHFGNVDKVGKVLTQVLAWCFPQKATHSFSRSLCFMGWSGQTPAAAQAHARITLSFESLITLLRHYVHAIPH